MRSMRKPVKMYPRYPAPDTTAITQIMIPIRKHPNPVSSKKSIFPNVIK
jgi:hypothetical protein